MTIPKIIHFTIPASPSPDQLKNIERARELHPGWQVIVWQDPIERANFRLAKYWDKTNSGAQLADLIRLEVVFQQGGFYLDADFALLKNLDPLRIYPFVVASEDGQVLTNAFFGAMPHSPVLKHLVDTLDEHEVDWRLTPEKTTGPQFFVRELRWRDDVNVLPRETFYTYNWYEQPAPARRWTYATHLWEHSWLPRRRRHPIRGLIGRIKHSTRKLRLKLLKGTRSALIRTKRLLHLGLGHSYPASGVLCAQTIHGPKIYLFGEDTSLTPEIALHGTYEFEEELFVLRVVRRGDWVIDVGANVGIFSLLFADRVGPCGRVFSYEPNPLPASLLKKSLVLNWVHDRVQVRQKALGSEPGSSRLRFSREVLGGATLVPPETAGTFENSIPLVGAENEIEVEVATLDAEFPVDLPIRLLKIDVEGFEHQVLRGAGRLLENHCIDILMLECLQEVYGKNWPRYVRDLEKIIATGYAPYTLNRSSKLQSMAFQDLFSAERNGRTVVFISKYATDTIREL